MTTPAVLESGLSNNPLSENSAPRQGVLTNGQLVTILTGEVDAIIALKNGTGSRWSERDQEGFISGAFIYTCCVGLAVLTGLNVYYGIIAYRAHEALDASKWDECFLAGSSNSFCTGDYHLSKFQKVSPFCHDNAEEFLAISKDVCLADWTLVAINVGVIACAALMCSAATYCTGPVVQFDYKRALHHREKALKEAKKYFTQQDADEAFLSLKTAQCLPILALAADGRRKIVSQLNAYQLMTLFRQLPSKDFNLLTKENFTNDQVAYLQPLLNIERFLGDLSSLKEFVEKDPSLFKEILQAIPEGRLEDSRRELEELAKSASLDIHSFISQEEKSPYLVQVVDEGGSLKTYHTRVNLGVDFEAASQKWVEKPNTVRLQLTNSEAHVFLAFLTYGESKDPALIHAKTAIPLLKLASRFDVRDLVELCYSYLIANFGQFKCEDALNVLLENYRKVKHCQKIAQLFGTQLSNAFSDDDAGKPFALLELMKKYPFIAEERDVLKGFGNVLKGFGGMKYAPRAFLHALFNSSLEKAQNAVLDEFRKDISRRQKEITPLILCLQIPMLYQAIEELYCASVNKDIFRSLWDFAEQHEKKRIKEACREFFHKTDNRSQLMSQWPIGEMPPFLSKSIN